MVLHIVYQKAVFCLALLCSIHAKSIPDIVNYILNGEPVPIHCGKSRFNALSFDRNEVRKRVVGGQASRHGEWPWLVTMQLLKDGSYQHMCGGTLIHPQWVLTAAHCFESFWADFLTDDPTQWRMRIGEHHMFVEEGTHVDVPASKILFNPKRHLPLTFNFDMALVKLEYPVELNHYVNVACLPASEDEFPAGTECVTAGWGHTTEGGNQSVTVRHVHLPLISNEECQSMYAKFPGRFKFKIYDDMLCAGVPEGGRDACQYDSGGPLVCYNTDDRQWLITAVISTGFGCARAGYPGIYTRVNIFTDWIEEAIGNN